MVTIGMPLFVDLLAYELLEESNLFLTVGWVICFFEFPIFKILKWESYWLSMIEQIETK